MVKSTGVLYKVVVRFFGPCPRVVDTGLVVTRLRESPYIDHAPTGPDTVFPEADVDNIVQFLNTVKANAAPVDGAA
jgi:hypothetical protein